jgi:sulfur carrier protein
LPDLDRSRVVPGVAPDFHGALMIQVNGEPLEWHEGMTVRDVLTAKKYVFPMLIITIDGKMVSRQDYNKTSVRDGATLEVVHLLSGG